MDLSVGRIVLHLESHFEALFWREEEEALLPVAELDELLEDLVPELIGVFEVFRVDVLENLVEGK